MMLAGLFTHPMHISASLAMWMILPLCFSVAVIYKTVRTDSLCRLPRQIAVLIGYMTGGLVVLAVLLWLVQVVFI